MSILVTTKGIASCIPRGPIFLVIQHIQTYSKPKFREWCQEMTHTEATSY